MISFKDIEDNIYFYKNSVKNKNLKSYYDHLAEDYVFNDSIDFTEFVNFLRDNEDKKSCYQELKKIRELGEKIEFEEKYYEDDYLDDFYSYEISPEHARAIEKNNDLVDQLEYLRKNALGIGTNKIKRRLNKLAKEDPLAKALRLAIEIEDVNIVAKKSYGKYRDKNYDKKSKLIFYLIEIFEDNNWIYGIHKDQGFKTNAIIFFEIPNTEQISFHANINNRKIKIYEKEWDKKVNSTYPKLIDSVECNFSEIIY